MNIKRSKRFWRILIATLLILVATIALGVGGFFFWSEHRPQPTSLQQTLFDGITYLRDVRQQPRPLVIHVIKIDLTTPGLSFLVSPGEPAEGHEVRARYTSEFLVRYDLQLAINGDFFYPWWYHSIFDWYPHWSDPTDINGLAASRGTVYSPTADNRPTLYLSRDNTARFDAPDGDIYNAISGLPMIVENGQVTNKIMPGEYYDGLHPRTAIALDQARRTLMLFIVDGRQPNYSEGVQLEELAAIGIEYGAGTMINLDGGGSSTLVVEDHRGRPLILNSPIDAQIPGRERPVGNQLGVYAQQLKSQSH
jgi:hypothetical protein